MDRYQNRAEAGKALAKALQSYADDPSVLVLALPRGGVPVAYEIAKSLSAPLDAFIVRKLGSPGYEELALGAIVMGGMTIFNDDIIQVLGISKQEIDHVIAIELQELKRRETSYRGNRPFPDLKNKKIILVDDGIATGATMRVAINALWKLNPAFIVVAVPVAAKTTCDAMAILVDNVVCPLQPIDFYVVGSHYIDFAQTTDAEVYGFLA